MSQRERIVQKGKVKSLDVPQTPNKNQLTFGQILANWSKNIWFCKCLNIYLVWFELSNAILISRLLSDGGEFAWYEVGCCDATNPGTSSPVPASDWRCDTFDTPVVESGGGYAQFLDRYIAWYLQLFKVWLSSSNRVSNIIVLLQLIIFSCLWFLTLNKGVWHQILLVHPFHICLDKNFSVFFPYLQDHSAVPARHLSQLLRPQEWRTFSTSGVPLRGHLLRGGSKLKWEETGKGARGEDLYKEINKSHFSCALIMLGRE